MISLFKETYQLFKNNYITVVLYHLIYMLVQHITILELPSWLKVIFSFIGLGLILYANRGIYSKVVTDESLNLGFGVFIKHFLTKVFYTLIPVGLMIITLVYFDITGIRNNMILGIVLTIIALMTPFVMAQEYFYVDCPKDSFSNGMIEPFNIAKQNYLKFLLILSLNIISLALYQLISTFILSHIILGLAVGPFVMLLTVKEFTQANKKHRKNKVIQGVE